MRSARFSRRTTPSSRPRNSVALRPAAPAKVARRAELASVPAGEPGLELGVGRDHRAAVGKTRVDLVLGISTRAAGLAVHDPRIPPAALAPLEQRARRVPDESR